MAFAISFFIAVISPLGLTQFATYPTACPSFFNALLELLIGFLSLIWVY